MNNNQDIFQSNSNNPFFTDIGYAEEAMNSNLPNENTDRPTTNGVTSQALNGVQTRRRNNSNRKPRKPRTIFTKKQIDRLKQLITIKIYFTSEERKSLAAELNLTEEQIKIWCQNYRSKSRRRTRLELAHSNGNVPMPINIQQPYMQYHPNALQNGTNTQNHNFGQYQEVIPNNGQCQQVLPNIGQYHQALPNNGQYQQGFPNYGQCQQVLPNNGQYQQMYPDMNQYHYMLPNMDQYQNMNANIIQSPQTNQNNGQSPQINPNMRQNPVTENYTPTNPYFTQPGHTADLEPNFVDLTKMSNDFKDWNLGQYQLPNNQNTGISAANINNAQYQNSAQGANPYLNKSVPTNAQSSQYQAIPRSTNNGTDANFFKSAQNQNTRRG